MDFLTVAGLWAGEKTAGALVHHWVEEFLERHGFSKTKGGGTTINHYNVHVVINNPAAPVPAAPVPIAPPVVRQLPPFEFTPERLAFMLNTCASCRTHFVALEPSRYCSDECRANGLYR